MIRCVLYTHTIHYMGYTYCVRNTIVHGLLYTIGSVSNLYVRGYYATFIIEIDTPVNGITTYNNYILFF